MGFLHRAAGGLVRFQHDMDLDHLRSVQWVQATDPPLPLKYPCLDLALRYLSLSLRLALALALAQALVHLAPFEDCRVRDLDHFGEEERVLVRMTVEADEGDEDEAKVVVCRHRSYHSHL